MTASTLRGPRAITTTVRRWLAFLLVLGAAVPLAACGSSGPQGWLDDNLTKVSGSDPDTGITYTAKTPIDGAVQQISGGTSPTDTLVSGGNTFLRYDDDFMVVLAGAAAGAATAQLFTFDAGYARYSSQVAAWDEFRGGGSGEGK